MVDSVALAQVERFEAGIRARSTEIAEQDIVRISLLSYVAAGETIRGEFSSDLCTLLSDAHARIERARLRALQVIN